MSGQRRSVVLTFPMDKQGGIVVDLPRSARVVMVAMAARQAPLVGPDGKKGIEQFPMLFVEGDPDVPDSESVPRKFVAVPKDTVVEGKPGSTVAWAGSAISQFNGMVVHVFEVFGHDEPAAEIAVPAVQGAMPIENAGPTIIKAE